MFTKARKMLVNGVVQHLKNAVVKTALVRIADIHSWSFPYRLQAFQLVDLRRVVLFGDLRRRWLCLVGIIGYAVLSGHILIFHQSRFVRHKKHSGGSFDRTSKASIILKKSGLEHKLLFA